MGVIVLRQERSRAVRSLWVKPDPNLKPPENDRGVLIAQIVFGSRESLFFLAIPVGRYFGYTLSPTTLNDLHRLAKCHGCGLPATNFLAHWSCKRMRWQPDAMVLAVTEDAFDNACVISRREGNRKTVFRRQRKLRINGGTHTREQIEQLYQLQSARCYYCYRRLSRTDGRPNFHRDHYIALEAGGSDSIDNIVLSCRVCNIKKADLSGDQIRSPNSKVLPSAEMRKRLANMRRRVDEWRSSHTQTSS